MKSQHLIKIVVLISVVFLLINCQQSREKSYTFTRFSMDTVIHYTIFAPSRKVAQNAMLKAQTEIDRVASKFWEKDSSSEIYRFNHSREGIITDREVYLFVSRARGYYQKTDHAFDISIYPVLKLYDFKAENPVPPTEQVIRTNLQFVGMQNVSMHHADGDTNYRINKKFPEVGIASGGSAKGYAVDRAIDVLKEQGISSALINAGGDLYCLGSKEGKPWVIGIQDPRDLNDVVAALTLEDMAIATSGDYQRYFMYEGVRYHHILNPKTGRPGRLSQSASVIASGTEQADAWATALFVLGVEEGVALANRTPGIDAAIIDSAGIMHYSSGFGKYLREE